MKNFEDDLENTKNQNEILQERIVVLDSENEILQ